MPRLCHRNTYHWNSSIAAIVAIFGVCNALIAKPPSNALTDGERRGGWAMLFDGKTTSGWRSYRQDDVSDGWTVQNGALTRSSKGAGDLITKATYRDFELSLEYKIAPGGNSGVMFHVTEALEKSHQTGPEVQILDNAIATNSGDQKTGWLYDLYGPEHPNWARAFEESVGFKAPKEIDSTRPAGQWNHLYLRVAEQGEVAINGVHYMYFNRGSDDWNQRVAKSKFAKFPEFGTADEGHICFQDHGHEVSFRNIKLRELDLQGGVPNPVDGELPIKAEVVFADLDWENWDSVDERGRIQKMRPLIMTPSGDGSKRIFFAMQGGRIYVLKDGTQSRDAKLFLDMSEISQDWSEDLVSNEEGLLGLAFHPSFGTNGQFFVYYSSSANPRTSVISRFRVSADDPNRADLSSEEVILQVKQPFPNHNGGAIAFGPDGYLYVAFGDGGYRDDPMALAQDLSSLMGSILRIDVDSTQDGLNYAIPADNPFLDDPSARPETFAYGFRNLWRIDFDEATGDLWAADVGQDLWEELNLVVRGGNYGWSIREGSHPFGNRDGKPASPWIDPIWEYDHQVGKSITGGTVYRGQKLPELQGYYVYGDYVSGSIWALKYDHDTKSVVKNMAIQSTGLPVYAIGEDAEGEIYVMTESSTGQPIYRLARAN